MNMKQENVNNKILDMIQIKLKSSKNKITVFIFLCAQIFLVWMIYTYQEIIQIILEISHISNLMCQDVTILHLNANPKRNINYLCLTWL